MKKVIAIFFFIVSQNFLFAQTYIPLPDTNAKWVTVLYVSPNCMNYGCPYSYTFNGDTLINTIVYKKLLSTSSYSGAIRQDTNTQRVYYVPKNYSNEYLLYDFSINVGDTITSYVDPGVIVPCHNTVFSIDSIYIGNKYRKRLRLSSDCWIGSWIEGVGSEAGLLEPWAGGPASYQLWCFEYNGKVLYPLPDTIYSSCDSTLLFVNEQNILNQRVVNISPNPFSNEAIIFLNQPFLKQTFSITVFSLLGKEIIKIKLISSETKIERGHLPSGIYFYKVQNENGSMQETGKIIIQ